MKVLPGHANSKNTVLMPRQPKNFDPNEIPIDNLFFHDKPFGKSGTMRQLYVSFDHVIAGVYNCC
jgi:hypothetical protein